MTKDEIIALIDAKIAGQGTMVDAGSALPAILKGILEIAVGGENVQSDWNEADNTKPDFIKNKPTIPAAQIQSDWNQSDDSAKDYIKNKPTIPQGALIIEAEKSGNNLIIDSLNAIKTAVSQGRDVILRYMDGDVALYSQVVSVEETGARTIIGSQIVAVHD